MGVRVPPSALNPLVHIKHKRFFFNLLNDKTLEINFDKIENSEALIKISLKDVDYQPQVTEKIKDFSKKANIKGFRPGKVPFGMIKKMYGPQITAEEINKIIGDSLNNYLKESDLQFLGEPVALDPEQPIDWVNQKDFDFTFNVGYAQDFDLKIDKKLKIENQKIKIDEGVMKETLANLQQQFGEITNADAISQGDTIYGVLSAKNKLEDKEVTFELKELHKNVSKKLIGLKVGASMDLDHKKSFNDERYFTHITKLTEEEIKSVKGKFTFTIKGISHTLPAPVNQELFDKTFGKDNVKTEEEFNSKIKETIEKNYEAEAVKLFHHKIREKIIEVTQITLPNKFLKNWLLRTNKNINLEILDKEYNHYQKELKWSLVRNKIAKDQAIKIENEEILNETKVILAQQFGGMAALEQLGDQIDTMAENYLKAENGDNYMKVFNEIQNRKVFGFIENEVTAKVKIVSLDDFRKN
ncbi:MAG: trigger factor [Flammeovirgaceae bacterium]|nr:trigger factor [Flammeovirgaceae bacterium]|tara:strand:+ start:3002 stop:4411 length:1410 start_codon:yes stop_codon:yes gene_type:complete